VVESGMGAGTNFGWNPCEGFEGYSGGSATGTACTFSHHEPVLAVNHGSDPVLSDGGQSITGGYVYRGSAIPALVGAYIFADCIPRRRVGVPLLRRRDDGVPRADGSHWPLQRASSRSRRTTAGELYMVCYGMAARSAVSSAAELRRPIRHRAPALASLGRRGRSRFGASRCATLPRMRSAPSAMPNGPAGAWVGWSRGEADDEHRDAPPNARCA
jgi:hypothetical protein